MNKVNEDNVVNVVQELIQENVIRARGILVQGMLKNQLFSPSYTNIFAAVISVLNAKLPQIGELLLKRLINNFKLYYSANMREPCVGSVTFLAHLTNQFVLEETLILEILFTLLEDPTPLSIEVACGLMRQVGAFLEKHSSRAA